MEGRLYSISKVAEILDMSEQTVRRRIKAGFFPNCGKLPVSNSTRITENDLQNFMENIMGIKFKKVQAPREMTNEEAYELYKKNMAKEGVFVGRKRKKVA
jgi:hypothetical protein